MSAKTWSGADVFRAPSGIWWAVHPTRPDRAFSLKTKDEAKARGKYAEMRDQLAEWKSSQASERTVE